MENQVDLVSEVMGYKIPLKYNLSEKHLIVVAFCEIVKRVVVDRVFAVERTHGCFFLPA